MRATKLLFLLPFLAAAASAAERSPAPPRPGDAPADRDRPVVPVLALGVVPPLQVGSEESDVVGLRLGLPYVSHHDVTGLDLALLATGATGDFSGVQAAPFYNRVDGTMRGVQVAAFNFAESVRGVQIGLLNGATSVSGVQIGFFNSTRTLSGVQIGLGNYVQESAVPFLPILNVRF
ncbi:MAG: hypothetical protein IJV65_06075 [Kiritimatiellae bacterium]|nr:hypothetical protein [Kiritimatiellia bacterium]